MSSSQAPYRGRVQAQGEDIEDDGGYSCPWAQNAPVTDRDGLEFLAKIEEQCSKSQKEQRKQAFGKARRFVENASKQGGVGPEAQPHSFQDKRRTVKNARVDIEIRSGLTFIPVKKPE
jgi:hypothetical protein